MSGLAAGRVVDATALPLTHEPVPAAEVRDGAPTTGLVALTETVGVWEHSPGVSTDVETDEVFVVLSGSGVITFTDPPLPPVELHAGVVVRLSRGMRTTWTITDTLRKVYFLP